jgi:hypothetical protein
MLRPVRAKGIRTHMRVIHRLIQDKQLPSSITGCLRVETAIGVLTENYGERFRKYYSYQGGLRGVCMRCFVASERTGFFFRTLEQAVPGEVRRLIFRIKTAAEHTAGVAGTVSAF